MPLPFTWRRTLFKFLSTSPLVAKLQYGLKILFIFVAVGHVARMSPSNPRHEVETHSKLMRQSIQVLFVDSLQRMTKIHNEGQAARDQGAGVGRDLRSETDWRSRKFLRWVPLSRRRLLTLVRTTAHLDISTILTVSGICTWEVSPCFFHWSCQGPLAWFWTWSKLRKTWPCWRNRYAGAISVLSASVT